ncbi:hypothetical protein POF50_009750 [Streptomyces sp. SL13]|uniref:Uncharacterized protein n=1 Tax=Streptantibioticus silvisoli TaxID=2705255 RepID=A0AA90H6C3_9ACTN|nr:hypothetical protein [Streptantibioticus silvisoli]MDI5965168.1 hypothetical protein [Streptantibioticus silvisoli]MDI5969620.1 hypothetical protein [Streptantibioticus silvisoli]
MKIATRCDGCGGLLICDASQYVEGDLLCWSSEGTCATCPNAWRERNPGGPVPEEIRRALLAESGPARLRLAGPEANIIAVVRVLAETQGLPLVRARALAGELRETGLTGTLVEMRFIATALERRSVAAVVETGVS